MLDELRFYRYGQLPLLGDDRWRGMLSQGVDCGQGRRPERRAGGMMTAWPDRSALRFRSTVYITRCPPGMRLQRLPSGQTDDGRADTAND